MLPIKLGDRKQGENIDNQCLRDILSDWITRKILSKVQVMVTLKLVVVKKREKSANMQ
jgi:hypothetical protein